MIGDKTSAVLRRLEGEDALQRKKGLPRRKRLRQIAPDVGRFLHVLVLATRPRSVLEIGTSGGYSTIWLATAARAVGAKVITVEIDPAKVELATVNLGEAGLTDAATVVHADAFDHLRDHHGPVDFAFLDAEKADYLGFLELIVPLLPIGGLLVADNVLSHAEHLADFRQRAESHPSLSALVVPIGGGELVAVKIE